MKNFLVILCYTILFIIPKSYYCQERLVSVHFHTSDIKAFGEDLLEWEPFLEYLRNIPSDQSFYMPVEIEASDVDSKLENRYEGYILRQAGEKLYLLEWKMPLSYVKVRQIEKELDNDSTRLRIYCPFDPTLEYCRGEAPLASIKTAGLGAEIKRMEQHPLILSLDSVEEKLDELKLDIGTIKMIQEKFDQFKVNLLSRLILPEDKKQAISRISDIDDKLDNLKELAKLQKRVEDLDLNYPKEALSLDELFKETNEINQGLQSFETFFPNQSRRIQKKLMNYQGLVLKEVDYGLWEYPQNYLTQLWQERLDEEKEPEADVGQGSYEGDISYEEKSPSKENDSYTGDSSLEGEDSYEGEDTFLFQPTFQNLLIEPFLPLGQDLPEIEFVLVPKGVGKFRMGITRKEFRSFILSGGTSGSEDKFNIASDEVIPDSSDGYQEIGYPFFLSRFEICREEFAAIISPGSQITYPRKPITSVTGEDLQRFLNFLSDMYPNLEIDIPTESEWEYAAKGAMSSRVYTWEGDFLLGEERVNVNSDTVRSVDVGAELENTSWCGAVDMIGNVKELCRIEPYLYKQKDQGEKYVARGGSYKESEFECRTTSRHPIHQPRAEHIGIRLVIRPKLNEKR